MFAYFQDYFRLATCFMTGRCVSMVCLVVLCSLHLSCSAVHRRSAAFENPPKTRRFGNVHSLFALALAIQLAPEHVAPCSEGTNPDIVFSHPRNGNGFAIFSAAPVGAHVNRPRIIYRGPSRTAGCANLKPSCKILSASAALS